jgi:hypothetical protein
MPWTCWYRVYRARSAVARARGLLASLLARARCSCSHAQSSCSRALRCTSVAVRLRPRALRRSSVAVRLRPRALRRSSVAVRLTFSNLHVVRLTDPSRGCYNSPLLATNPLTNGLRVPTTSSKQPRHVLAPGPCYGSPVSRHRPVTERFVCTRASASDFTRIFFVSSRTVRDRSVSAGRALPISFYSRTVRDRSVSAGCALPLSHLRPATSGRHSSIDHLSMTHLCAQPRSPIA